MSTTLKAAKLAKPSIPMPTWVGMLGLVMFCVWLPSCWLEYLTECANRGVQRPSLSLARRSKHRQRLHWQRQSGLTPPKRGAGNATRRSRLDRARRCSLARLNLSCYANRERYLLAQGDCNAIPGARFRSRFRYAEKDCIRFVWSWRGDAEHLI